MVSTSLVLFKLAIRIKKPIKTKFRLPVFNWTALKPNQISGTVFSELDDEKILEVAGLGGPEIRVWGHHSYPLSQMS